MNFGVCRENFIYVCYWNYHLTVNHYLKHIRWHLGCNDEKLIDGHLGSPWVVLVSLFKSTYSLMDVVLCVLLFCQCRKIWASIFQFQGKKSKGHYFMIKVVYTFVRKDLHLVFQLERIYSRYYAQQNIQQTK